MHGVCFGRHHTWRMPEFSSSNSSSAVSSSVSVALSRHEATEALGRMAMRGGDGWRWRWWLLLQLVGGWWWRGHPQRYLGRAGSVHLLAAWMPARWPAWRGAKPAAGA